MNILMHCVYFPPEIGGLESHVYNLCRGLVARGHRVTVVTSRSQPGSPRRERVGGVDVIRTWFPGRNPPGWALHSLCSAPHAIRATRRAHVLHAQAFASIPPMALARRLHGGTPLVTTIHTSHFRRLARRRLWRPGLRVLLREADHIFATSADLADLVNGLSPRVTAESLTNAVDVSVFKRSDPALRPGLGMRLVVPSRLHPVKGVRFFVRAMPEIAAAVPGVEAILVGDGPEREELESLSAQLGVAERIRFLGTRPNAEMPGILSSATVAVLPSLMEATSIAALEAMACELPVAASRVGGLPEIVDESVGTLFEPGDPADLARRLVALLGRTNLREAGRRARQRVATRWSNDRLVGRHLEVYEALRAGKRAPHA